MTPAVHFARPSARDMSAQKSTGYRSGLALVGLCAVITVTGCAAEELPVSGAHDPKVVMARKQLAEEQTQLLAAAALQVPLSTSVHDTLRSPNHTPGPCEAVTMEPIIRRAHEGDVKFLHEHDQHPTASALGSAVSDGRQPRRTSVLNIGTGDGDSPIPVCCHCLAR